MNRRPDQKLPFPQFDSKGLGFDEAIDEAARIVQKPAELPSQVWEWVKDDFKQGFNVGASPSSSLLGSELYQFDRGETADVKGVYSSINLLDLTIHPIETAKKFAQSSINAVNPLAGILSPRDEFWTDLDTAAQRTMWANLVKGSDKGGLFYGEAKKSFGGPINLTDQGVYKAADLFSTEEGKEVTVANGVDLYKRVAENTLGFVGSKKSAFFRNIAYRNFAESVVEAAKEELSQKNITEKIGEVAGLSYEDKTRWKLKIQTFIDEGGLAGDVGSLSGDLRGFREKITQTELGMGGQVNVKVFRGKLNETDKRASAITSKIEAIRASLDDKPEELASFNARVKDLENFANDVKGLTSKYKGLSDNDALSRMTTAEGLVSSITQLESRLANPRFNGGIRDRYLEDLSRRYMEGPRSVFSVQQILRDVRDPTDSSKPLLSEGFASLPAVYGFQRNVYWQEAGRDLWDTVLKGKLSTQFLWFGSYGEIGIAGQRIQLGLIKDRIQMFTPGYWVKQGMVRTHNLGLSYEKDYKGKLLHPIFEKNPLLRDNYFSETISFKGASGATETLTARFKGSEGLGSYYSAWSASKQKKLVGAKGALGNVVFEKEVEVNKKAFLRLLNRGSNAPGGYFIDNKEWEKIVKDVAVRNDLIQKLGLSCDSSGFILEEDAVNLEKLEAFFSKIDQRVGNPAFLNPFAEKYGLLQRYASVMSRIQQQVYKRLGLSKVSLAFAELKTAIANKVASLVAKLAVRLGLRALLDTATGGLAEFVMPIIDKVVSAVLAKLIDRTKAMIKAILRGDFGAELNKLMNDAMHLTERVLMIGCIIPTIMTLAVIMLAASIMAAINPVDIVKQAAQHVSDTVAPIRPEPIEGTDCVFSTYIKSCLSFRGGSVAGGCTHGSNYYWAPKDHNPYNPAIDGMRDCSLNIPYFDGGPANGPVGDSTSWCSGASLKKPYYGYALDVVPASDPDGAWVYAPKISGVESWSLGRVNRIDQYAEGRYVGCSVVLNGNDGTHNYSILLLHLGCLSLPNILTTSLEPGDSIARLYNYSAGKHVHIELKVDGSYKRPEDYMCK